MRRLGTTIAAVATPAGVGAVAVIRISGPSAFEVAGAVNGVAATVTPRRAQVRRLRDRADAPLDEALTIAFSAPASFTGEDVVELHCHGGALTSRRVLEALFAAGATAAEPGEFTARALANGRLDLTQAEAIADVIRAEGDAAHRLAQEQLRGGLRAAVEPLTRGLADLLVRVEAAIDFSLEEHVYSVSSDEVVALAAPIEAGLERLLSTYAAGRRVREGVRVAIVGYPNAGKSSLLNRWLSEERALVSPIPGTTRDTVEEVVEREGVAVRLIDTAGLRAADDPVEVLGVARARRAAEAADALVVVADCRRSGDLAAVLAELPARPWVLVWTHADLGDRPGVALGGAGSGSEPSAAGPSAALAAAWVSLTDGAAGDGAAAADAALDLAVRSVAGPAAAQDGVLTRERHRECIAEAAARLGAAVEAARDEAGHELVAYDLRAALDALGSLTGAVTAEAILQRIFAEFCVGK